ncbi:MAG: tetratricopeptide repeat protein [Chitinophagaceae bacterium]
MLIDLSKIYGQGEQISEIINNQPERIETLRVITGGVIRTIVVLFDIFIADEEGNSFRDLEVVLDRVTPLYKHRIDDLNFPQREIINIIALNWNAIQPSEIAKKGHLEEAEVFRILKELEKLYIVEAKFEKGDNVFYQLKERFFNIWYLMRLAPQGDKKKVIWLVKFLNAWYSRHEIKQRAKEYIDRINKGVLNTNEAYLRAAAFALTGQLGTELEHQVITQTRSYLAERDRTMAEMLSDSEKEMLDDAINLYNNNRQEEAIQLLMRSESNPSYLLGRFYSTLNNHEQSIKYYHESLRTNDAHVSTWKGLGVCYYDLGDYAKAKTHWLKAIELDNTDPDIWYDLGLAENSLNNQTDAIKHLGKAIEIDKNYIDAWNTLGSIYDNLKDYEKSISNYERSIEINERNIEAWNGLGVAYDYLKDYDKALWHFKKILEIDDKQVIGWHNQGASFFNQAKYQEAIPYFLKALEIDQQYADSIYFLALSYENLKEYEKAIAYFHKAIENTTVYTTHALYQLGGIYEKTGFEEKAKTFYQQVVSVKPEDYPSLKYKLLRLQLQEAIVAENGEKTWNILQEACKPFLIRTNYLDFKSAGQSFLSFIPRQDVIIECATLPFYEKIKLYKLTARNTDQLPFRYLLSDQKKVYPLNLSNEPIYETNNLGFFINSQNVFDYVIFFFDAVAGRHGRFHILRNKEEIPWLLNTPADAKITEALRSYKIEPIISESADEFVISCYMIFKNSLFSSNVHVVKVNGLMSLDKETLIIEGMPVKDIDLDTPLDILNSLKKAIIEDPVNYEAWHQLGYIYKNELRDPNLAIESFTSAVEINGKLTDAWLELGTLYQQRNEYEKSITAFNKALEADNKNEYALFGAGFGNEIIGNTKQAIGFYNDLLKLNENNKYAHYNLGLIYDYRYHDFEKALTHYKSVADLGDDNAANSVAWLCYKHKKKRSLALQYASAAIEKVHNIHYTNTIACIYLWDNQIEKSLDFAKAFLYNDKYISEVEPEILNYLLHLAAKKQTGFLKEYLEGECNKYADRFKPVYYAILKITGSQEYSRITNELIEPVREIIAEIDQMAIDYA